MTLYHVDDKDLTYTVFPILINFLLYIDYFKYSLKYICKRLILKQL